jgi:hypothetical protein
MRELGIYYCGGETNDFYLKLVQLDWSCFFVFASGIFRELL